MPNFSAFGSKRTLPSLFPGTLQFPSGMAPDWNTDICAGLSRQIFSPLRLPRLRLPIPAPAVPDWNFTIPTLPAPMPSPPFGFVYDHVELQPGAQSTFPIGESRQDAFVLTTESLYRHGPAEGGHIEADVGAQIGAPFAATSSDGTPWTFNPFVQLTDVDRFGALGGLFRFWQPYAQIGFQT